MKHFVIALLLFGLTVTFVCINGNKVKAFSDEITGRIESLPESETEFSSCRSEVEKIVELWKENKDYLSLSLHKTELERISDGLSELASSAETNDHDGFIAAKRKLEFSLKEIADGEIVGFFNIF